MVIGIPRSEGCSGAAVCRHDAARCGEHMLRCTPGLDEAFALRMLGDIGKNVGRQASRDPVTGS